MADQAWIVEVWGKPITVFCLFIPSNTESIKANQFISAVGYYQVYTWIIYAKEHMLYPKSVQLFKMYSMQKFVISVLWRTINIILFLRKILSYALQVEIVED